MSSQCSHGLQHGRRRCLVFDTQLLCSPGTIQLQSSWISNLWTSPSSYRQNETLVGEQVARFQNALGSSNIMLQHQNRFKCVWNLYENNESDSRHGWLISSNLQGLYTIFCTLFRPFDICRKCLIHLASNSPPGKPKGSHKRLCLRKHMPSNAAGKFEHQRNLAPTPWCPLACFTPPPQRERAQGTRMLYTIHCKAGRTRLGARVTW